MNSMIGRNPMHAAPTPRPLNPAWAMNVGTVFSVTCSSLEYSAIIDASGFSPISRVRLPLCATPSAIVITGDTQASVDSKTLFHSSRVRDRKAAVNVSRNCGQPLRSFCAGNPAGSRPRPSSSAA